VADEVEWDVHAIRLGSVERPARENFLQPGDRTGSMRLDFTIWLLRSGDDMVLLDTGFAAEAGLRRGRVADRTPALALVELGLDPADVGHVVLSHAHYDHAGNVGDFPGAEVVVQAEELAYVTGDSMRHASLNHFFEVDDVVDLVRRVHAGSVRVVDGDVTLLPGQELYLIGGHTRGLQVVRVRTARGWVVLASDALHYYENLAERNPFPAILDLGMLLDGYDRIERLADTIEHVVPGHDPDVFVRYVDESSGLPDGIVALHHAPRPDPT
jgi:glyoxylase-like metal-dependent hydrolase (beta-lactamase superfamily II)